MYFSVYKLVTYGVDTYSFGGVEYYTHNVVLSHVKKQMHSEMHFWFACLKIGYKKNTTNLKFIQKYSKSINIYKKYYKIQAKYEFF